MRILLIDDDPGVSENLEDHLEDGAHETQVLNYIENKKEFKKILEKFEPEGVVLDYDMFPPGLEVFRWIQSWLGKKKGRPKISIVFYTNYARSPGHRQAILDAGVRKENIVTKAEVADDLPRILRALGGG